MSKALRRLLTSLFILFFSIQFYLTLFGGFFWPFASHRLFSQLPLMEKPIVQAVLEDAEGNLFFVHPGRVIPIEYARCSGLIRKLASMGSREQQQTFIEYLLKRLNTGGWYPFDEMFASAKSPTGLPFTSLHFETHVVEFKELPYPQSVQQKERILLFP